MSFIRIAKIRYFIVYSTTFIHNKIHHTTINHTLTTKYYIPIKQKGTLCKILSSGTISN